MSESLQTIGSLFHDSWFLGGVAIAAVVAAVGWGARIPRPWIGAAALLVGTGGATYNAGQFRWIPFIGAVGLALATGIATQQTLGQAALVPLAYVVSWRSWVARQVTWPRYLGAAVTIVVLWGPRRFSKVDPRSLGLVVGPAAVGIWLSVADTEVPRALMGATLVVTAVAVLAKWRILEGPAIGAFVGLASWATLFGASARLPVSVFGGWLSLALLAVLGWRRLGAAPPWAWFAAEVVLALVGSRIVAVASSGWAAVGISGVALAVAGAIVSVAADRRAGV
jgi:hypothetical protein